MKYPELTGVCKKCEFGCNRLEDINFRRSRKVQVLYFRADNNGTNEDGGNR